MPIPREGRGTRWPTGPWTLVCVLGVAGLVTCSEGGTGPVPYRVEVSGPSQLYEGESSQLSAAVRDEHGNPVDTLTVRWRSTDSTVARVTVTGLVTAVRPGTAVIAADVTGGSGSLSLLVLRNDIAFVAVSPAQLTLQPGFAATLVASPRDSTGTALAGRTIVWSTSDSIRAQILVPGRVIARAPGLVTVSATSQGMTGTATVWIPPGVAALAIAPESAVVLRRDTTRLTATPRDSTGRPLSRTVTWRSLDTTIATIDQAGLIVGWEVGRTTVVATSEGRADTAAVVVTWGAVLGIDLDLISPSFLAVGYDWQTLIFTATQAGTIHTYPATFVSRDPSIVQAVATGGQFRVRAISPGTTVVVAQAGGASDSSTVVVERPPASIRIVPDTVITPVGVNAGLQARVLDDEGRQLRSPLITWSVSDTTIAGLIAGFVLVPKGAGTVTVVATAGVVSDTAVAVVTASRHPVPTFVPVGVAHRLAPGETLQIAVDVVDSLAASVPGVPVALTSLDTAIAIIEPAQVVSQGPVPVTLRGRAQGDAILLAQAPDRTTSGVAIVTFEYITSLRLTPRPTVMPVGDSLQLTADLRDQSGGLRAYPVNWSSSDSSTATITPGGLLHALAPGTVSIVARGYGRADSLRLGVMPPTAPRITAITPDTLVAGDAATIIGEHFDPSPASNVVTIEGAPIAVVAATASALTLALPPSSALPCAPTGARRLTVAVGPLYGDTVHPARVAHRPRLAPDTVLKLVGPGDGRCNEVEAAGGTYVVSLVNANPDPSATARFVLRSAPLTASPVGIAPVVPAAPGGGPAGRDPRIGPDSAPLRRAAVVHRIALAGDARLLAAAAPASPGALHAPPIDARVGAISAVRVPLINLATYCADYTTVYARTVFVGTRTLVLEDVTAPLARQMDGPLGMIGQEFDNLMYQVLSANVGDPLARDAALDGDGRVALLFSPAVNGFGGLGVFTVACDLVPRTIAPSSNEAELLYGSVPTSLGGFETPTSIAVWRWVMRAAVMHQAKHLTAYAERLQRGIGPEDLWLEEATALAAEEIWARGVYGIPYRGSQTYVGSLYCEVRPTWPACPDRPFVMYQHFTRLHDDLLEWARRSPLGGDPPGVGLGWALLRWAVDGSAGTEGAFLRALVQEPVARGAANLAARAGRPLAALLSDFTATIVLRGFPTTIDQPELRFPSWDLRSIFAGMSGDFPADFSPWPVGAEFLNPEKGETGVIQLRGAAAAPIIVYFGLTGAQFLEVRPVPGGPPLPPITLEVFRFQQ